MIRTAINMVSEVLLQAQVSGSTMRQELSKSEAKASRLVTTTNWRLEQKRVRRSQSEEALMGT